MKAHSTALPLQELVEAQGHLIDSHIMEQIFDTVVEFHGRFEVEQFRIGRTNGEPSYLRLKVDTDDTESMEKILSQLLGLGCSMVETGDAELATWEGIAARRRISIPPRIIERYIRRNGQWLEVQNQRMDALIVVQGDQAWCRRLRDVRAGDRW